MPTMMNAALFMRKWGGKRVKHIRRNFKRKGGSRRLVGDKNQKLAWSSSIEHAEKKALDITIRMHERNEDEENVGISFKKGNAVLYKDDKDRFNQQCTLKLKTFSLYAISLEVNQGQDLVYAEIGGKKYNCFKLYDNPDNSTKVYMFTWSTQNVQPTQRKYRTILPVVMKFKHYAELTFNLSVKFYYKDNVLHFSGLPLNLIDIHAQVGVGDLHQTVMNGLSFE